MKYEDIMIEDYGEYFAEAMELHAEMRNLNHRHMRLLSLRNKILGNKWTFIRKLIHADRLYKINNSIMLNELKSDLNMSRVGFLTKKALGIKEDLLKHNTKEIEEKIRECGINPSDGLGAVLALQGKHDNYEDSDDNQW